MSGPWLAGAWGLSVLPFLLARATGGDLEVEGIAWFGLVLLPWLAVAGMPRHAPLPATEPAVRPPAPWVGVAALALPALALGVGLDAAGGRSEVWLPAVLGVALVAGLAAGASGAARHPRARGIHAAAWLVLVPGTAALLVALGWIGAPGAGDAPAFLRELARWNPLVWAHAAASAGDPGGAGLPLRPLLAVAVLGLAPLAGARRGAEEEAGP